VTIDDAIVSICKNENEELKRLQGRLQREGSEEDIDAVMRARVAVKDIEARAIEALGVARAERAALVEAAKQNNPQVRASAAGGNREREEEPAAAAHQRPSGKLSGWRGRERSEHEDHKVALLRRQKRAESRAVGGRPPEPPPA
jgi:hypothetical protein